jgi:carbon starvation protein CstA
MALLFLSLLTFFGLSNTLFKGQQLLVVFFFLLRKEKTQIYLLRKVVCLFVWFVCHVEISQIIVPLTMLLAPLKSSQ